MLEARGITYAYPGAARALYQGFDLAVAPDERVALCAPSGFGKTTLCRLLAGYERPQAGEVLVDGEPLPRRGACPVQMIWQHPEAAVDPRMRMGATLAEAGEAAYNVPGTGFYYIAYEGMPADMLPVPHQSLAFDPSAR